MASRPEERSPAGAAAAPAERPRGATRAANPGPGHSDIFERLSANDESDLVGLVAYGLYQRRKRSWIAAFQKTHGRYPKLDERDAFAFGHQTEALEALRNDAENVLAAFGESVAEEQIDRLRTDALSAQAQAALSGIDAQLAKLKSYRHHVVGHLLAFCILVGIVAFGTAIIKFEPSVERAYHWLFPPDPPKSE